MKYIKTYEGKRKKCDNCNFQVDDYVKFTEDYVNGAPVKDISKEIFQIEKKSITGEYRANMYLLKYLNGDLFVWVYEGSLKPASPEEIEFTIATKKYNL